MASRFTWRGAQVRARLYRAAVAGVDDTTAATAIQAKGNHPGWQNRTGTAEGSIRSEPARQQGNRVRGRVGSFDVDYFIWLELKHGSALRNAADLVFPTLPSRIRDHFEGGR